MLHEKGPAISWSLVTLTRHTYVTGNVLLKGSFWFLFVCISSAQLLNAERFMHWYSSDIGSTPLEISNDCHHIEKFRLPIFNKLGRLPCVSRGYFLIIKVRSVLTAALVRWYLCWRDDEYWPTYALLIVMIPLGWHKLKQSTPSQLDRHKQRYQSLHPCSLYPHRWSR